MNHVAIIALGCRRRALCYVAALAARSNRGVGAGRVPTADIVVTDDIGDRACAIQVKTRRQLGSDGGWHMKAKHEGIRGASLFYVFLSFPNDVGALPDAFVVPSTVVADVLRISHQTWLARPGRKGQPHKDGEMRRFLPDYSHLDLANTYGSAWLEPYRDAWDQLRAGADAFGDLSL